MGNDHSREGPSSGEVLGTVTAFSSSADAENQEESLTGRDSPRPSLCSESDLPYISYTVNRPIGESPKRLNKSVLKSSTGVSASSSRSSGLRKKNRRPQEVVVVREASSSTMSVPDPEMLRIQRIPNFLPIMRRTLTSPSFKDPNVLERLEVTPFYSLCRRYQMHLHAAALLVASHQERLTASIKQVDSKLAAVVSSITDRQRAYARYAERLSQVAEVSHSLARLHSSLNLTLESVDTLNNLLPDEHRLESFIWATG